MRISDWSSDVCSSDLEHCADRRALALLQGSERFRLTARLLHVPGKLFDKADMLILRPCPQLNEMALQPINRITEWPRGRLRTGAGAGWIIRCRLPRGTIGEKLDHGRPKPCKRAGGGPKSQMGTRRG